MRGVLEYCTATLVASAKKQNNRVSENDKFWHKGQIYREDNRYSTTDDCANVFVQYL